MDPQFLMDTAMLAGEIMLRSGAETYRVEDTMMHIMKSAEKFETAEILVIMTGISATLKIAGRESITVIKRVKSRGTNLKRVVEINALSRRYCEGEITLSEMHEGLSGMREKDYSKIQYSLALIGTCAGFTLFFGGGIWDMAAALGVGAVLTIINIAGEKLSFNELLQNICSSVGIAAASILLKMLFGSRMNLDIVMIGSIMPLVPGMAITNAVRDILKGDYLSGAGRVLEAFLVAVSIAIGVALGITMFSWVLGGGMIS